MDGGVGVARGAHRASATKRGSPEEVGARLVSRARAPEGFRLLTDSAKPGCSRSENCTQPWV